MSRRASRSREVVVVIVGLVALAVFWCTAYPSITWWDSSSYATAAYTLGITGPPGSLLLTLLGWPVAHLPIGDSPARRLNLLAGVLGALTIVLVIVTALRLELMSRTAKDRSPPMIVLGAGVGSLGLAFSADLWEHAIKFTPYVLTATFTVLILLVMLRWWQVAGGSAEWRWLLLLGLLFGIDVSVHRTNLLLVPAVLVWVAVRRVRTLREPGAVAAAIGGFVAGLSVQLLLIPIARSTGSPMNFFEPKSLRALWDYVSLAGLGGNFLLTLWPRHSPFFTNQLADLLRAARDSFLPVRGPAGLFGILPTLFVTFGAGALVHRFRRLGIAWLAVLLIQSTLTVAYFNIPANFFRPFDRHYLPIVVTLGITMAFGGAAVAGWLVRSSKRRVPAIVGFAAVVGLPVAQLATNWRDHDAADRHFTSDYAGNALEALPADAIYFTMGDNDTFPVFYAQSVEGVRPDVTIINLSLSNADWYVAQLAREPRLPLSSTEAARQSAVGTEPAGPLRIPVAGSTDTLALPPAPMYGPRYQLADIVLQDLLRTNGFRRPVTFALTVGSGIDWLQPNLHIEGLYWHLMPEADPKAELEVLRHNLLERYRYRGYADPRIPLDGVTRTFGGVYGSAFQMLATAARDREGPAACREVIDRYLTTLPLERVPMPEATPESLRDGCNQQGSKD